MLVIFLRKVPVLAELPVQSYQSGWRKKGLRKLAVYVNLLTRQIVVLKTFVCQKISQRFKQKLVSNNNRFKDDLWQKIRKRK